MHHEISRLGEERARGRVDETSPGSSYEGEQGLQNAKRLCEPGKCQWAGAAEIVTL